MTDVRKIRLKGVSETVKEAIASVSEDSKQNIRAEIERRKEYEQKGWQSPFDLIEDILERGTDAVKADRLAIKSRHPKIQAAKS